MFLLHNKQKHSSQRQDRIIGRRSQLPKVRGGGAAVEAAFCFPLIVLLMMGTLEVCAGIYLKESLTVCAFEGIRVGVHRNATAEEVMESALAALEDRQITIPDNDDDLGVTISPSDFGALDALDPITITIVAPTAGNSLYIFDSLVNRNVSASVTMVREFDSD